MRVEINIDTPHRAAEFCAICSSLDKSYEVWIEDSNGWKVSARSLLGCMCYPDFNHIYCVCNKDISGRIVSFII